MKKRQEKALKEKMKKEERSLERSIEIKAEGFTVFNPSANILHISK